jgi:hypothetical protein
MQNNYFVTDEELTTYINNSLAELDDLLTTEYEDYRLSSFQAVLPSSGISNVIAIPSTMNKLRGVDYLVQNGGQPITLYPFQFTQRNNNNNTLVNLFSPIGKQRLTYRLADQGIIIEPINQASGTFTVYYTPKFSPLVLTTDILPIQMDTNAWVEYTVVDCCIKILNKQNLDPSGFMAEKQALRARIVGAAKNRDSSGPKKIANTRYQDEYWSPFGWNDW